jgi:hypothetical protein
VTLPTPRRPKGFGVTLLATLSPLTAFALERANVDLIMFLMLVAGVNCWLGTQRLRVAGYGIFITAGVLKFYPFVLMALALRERPRAFVAICAVTLLVLAAFGLAFHEELARVSANIPTGSPYGDMFGAINLPYGIVLLGSAMANSPVEAGPWAFGGSVGSTVGMLVLTVVAMTCAFMLEKRLRLTAAISAMPRREAGFLAAGAFVVCACFFAGQNVGYRAIMILPALPGLLWLGRSLPTRAGRVLFMGASTTIVFVMWVTLFQQLITRFDAEFGITALLYWLINQLAWWSLITILLAVVLGFALSSEMGRLCLRSIEGLRALTASAVKKNRIALDTARVLTRTSGQNSEPDATQETGHEIRHLL